MAMGRYETMVLADEFFMAILSLVVVAAGSVVWYARSSYYVGLEGEQLVIYQGRPENVLWFKPTLAERTNILTSDVLPSALPDLQKGATQSSLADAHSYVRNLKQAANEARSPLDTTSQPATSNPATDQTSIPTTSSPPTSTP